MFTRITAREYLITLLTSVFATVFLLVILDFVDRLPKVEIVDSIGEIQLRNLIENP